ncbi:hypothetical protein AWC38_SpisGene18499 [Stylophora pistillata]|uniref:Uncharacterized protein n=1 Tax=Stylophora pistillata TaxID=50429 RepID=A0A2B4RJ33_STYPI|nr:hypothetical protein AWC38_SpisGene18499 [Stylophora pistillata]
MSYNCYLVISKRQSREVSHLFLSLLLPESPEIGCKPPILGLYYEDLSQQIDTEWDGERFYRLLVPLAMADFNNRITGMSISRLV